VLESFDTSIKSYLPRPMIVRVRFADLLPIDADSSAKSPDHELVGEILRVISEDLTVIPIPSTPGVHEVSRLCIHGVGKCTMTVLLQQCESV
jgi:hypothetical protein